MNLEIFVILERVIEAYETDGDKFVFNYENLFLNDLSKSDMKKLKKAIKELI